MGNQTVAVIGAGNGGHAAAAELALMGYTVRMHDLDAEVVAGIASKGGIEVSGVMSGFGAVAFAGTDLARVVEGADLIVVITARFAHAEIAEALAPLLREGQAVLLNPGSTCGALEFAKVLRENGSRSPVSATATLPYAARVEEPGRVRVTLLAKTLFFATFPGRETVRESQRWSRLFPEIEPMSSDLEVSLNNGNPITHPAPMLLNAARIENTGGDFFFYRDGTSPSVVRVSEALDRERMALCRELNLKEIPATERLYRLGYADRRYPALLDVYQNSQAFGPIKAPESMDYRYVFEDIPYGSVFFASLGKALGVPTPVTDTIIDLAGVMMGRDFRETGLTMSRLGLEGLASSELLDFFNTGRSPKVNWAE